jgi:hypothetical protein
MFRNLGNARRCASADRTQERLVWCLTGSFVAHLLAFWGVCYFDQMQVAWYAVLAMIGTAAAIQNLPADSSESYGKRFEHRYECDDVRQALTSAMNI